MEIKKYFDNKKHFQSLFYQFIGNSNDDNLQFQNNFINENKYLFDVEELKHFLRFISTISGNINRYQQNIIDKTKFILLNHKNEIKQTLSNFELFQIFKDNKLILLFLFENEMIHFDIYIEDSINMMKFEDGTEYCHFFYPEIKNAEKKYIFNIKTIEKELFEIDPKIFEEFEKKRQIGENDSYLCSLIRNDEAIEFISYVNRMNISLNSFVKSSIFETNSFLIGKKTTLIEYAAFFGSIQIFQYLRLNGVDLNPSIWLYAIHSNNPELIHLLEKEKIINNDQEYEKCFEESIKCHHNEIANYIKDVLMMKLPENLYLYATKYCNYLFLPEEIDVLTAFFYLCHFDFYKIVNFYLKEKENEIETIIILKYNF